ncbi:MAG: peptide deformylase [Campylobacterales bacterium]
MIRRIFTYPDKVLKKKSKPVTAFNASLHGLLDDMYETMVDRNGVGLAAIQVGEALRALIILLPDEEGNYEKSELLEVINPVIIEKDGSVRSNEGCLSVPEYYDEVDRFENIKVEYQDRDGNKKTIRSGGFIAIALQHEMDHLEGHLFVEKLSLMKRKKFEKEYKKLQKNKRL